MDQWTYLVVLARSSGNEVREHAWGVMDLWRSELQTHRCDPQTCRRLGFHLGENTIRGLPQVDSARTCSFANQIVGGFGSSPLLHPSCETSELSSTQLDAKRVTVFQSW